VEYRRRGDLSPRRQVSATATNFGTLTRARGIRRTTREPDEVLDRAAEIVKR
jgi:hypothetical protein